MWVGLRSYTHMKHTKHTEHCLCTIYTSVQLCSTQKVGDRSPTAPLLYCSLFYQHYIGSHIAEELKLQPVTRSSSFNSSPFFFLYNRQYFKLIRRQKCLVGLTHLCVSLEQHRCPVEHSLCRPSTAQLFPGSDLLLSPRGQSS